MELKRRTSSAGLQRGPCPPFSSNHPLQSKIDEYVVYAVHDIELPKNPNIILEGFVLRRLFKILNEPAIFIERKLAVEDEKIDLIERAASFAIQEATKVLHNYLHQRMSMLRTPILVLSEKTFALRVPRGYSGANNGLLGAVLLPVTQLASETSMHYSVTHDLIHSTGYINPGWLNEGITDLFSSKILRTVGISALSYPESVAAALWMENNSSQPVLECAYRRKDLGIIQTAIDEKFGRNASANLFKSIRGGVRKNALEFLNKASGIDPGFGKFHKEMLGAGLLKPGDL